MKLSDAQRIGASLLERFAPAGGGFIAGSTRRQVAAPRDIELVLPGAAEDSQIDSVYEAMQQWVRYPGMGQGLFAGPFRNDPTWMLDAAKGFKPGFLYCQLTLDTAMRKGWPSRMQPFTVDVWRFSPANFGWCMVHRTGSDEFARAVLQRWKQINRTLGTDHPGSVDGEFVTGDGEVVATPTEERVFELCQIEWVEPVHRVDARAVKPLRLTTPHPTAEGTT